MTAQDELQRAIQLMQNGEAEAAAEQLNRLANSPTLDAQARAAAYVWLAEARADRDYKVRCLERALAHEPGNAQIRQGLQQLRSAPDQPRHLPVMRAERDSASQLQRRPQVVGINGGANGLASAAFIGSGGLLATTSYAVGSAARVEVHIPGEREMSGAVVRRFPHCDLALVSAPVKLARKPAVAPPSMAADTLTFTAHSATGMRLRGQLNRADRGLPSHWLATNTHLVQVPDAGGNPLVDGQGQLVGLLTRNSDLSGAALAIKVAHILALAQAFRRDRQLLPTAGYCAACGSLTQAGRYGGRSCETCGAALAAGKLSASTAPDRAALLKLYGEESAPPCSHCRATVGQHEGRCLRCGQGQPSRLASGG